MDGETHNTELTERLRQENKILAQQLEILAQENKLLHSRIDSTQSKSSYLAKIHKIVTGQENTLPKSYQEYEQETRFYLENIIAKMPGHVYWKDISGKYLGCNDQQANYLGFQSGKEIVGKTDFDLPWGKGAELFSEIDKKVMQTKTTIEAEEPTIAPSGKPIIFLSKKVPLLNKDGVCIGLLGVSFDITAQKQLEKELIDAKLQAEISNKAKTKFIANISHDIRTPLSGIINITQVLESKVKLQEHCHLINKINLAASNLLRILNQIIDLSRSENGALPIKKEQFNLHTTINDIINSLSAGAELSSNTIKLTYPSNIPHDVIGDQLRTSRILLNIVSNAIKFSNKKEIFITLNLLTQNKDKIKLEITIQDQGIGMDSKQLPLIFERFSRLNPSYLSNDQGVGLGLSIVKAFISDLKGKIEVKSQLNHGSSFICTLPFKTPTEKHQRQHRRKEKKSHLYRQAKQSLKILLIEDDQMCRFAEKLLLEDLGHTVDTARSGAEALIYINTNNYELIITDIGLPDIDGLALAEKMRAHDKQRNTPIIALTAHIADPKKDNFSAHGINSCLLKPLESIKLQKIINALTES